MKLIRHACKRMWRADLGELHHGSTQPSPRPPHFCFVRLDHIHVRFDLDPPHGVGALRIGMTRKEARKALETLGQCRPFARYKSPPGWLLDRGRAGNGTTAIFAYCDASGQVDAIEFGTPGFGVPAEDEIVYRDIDVFRSPAS